jgi:hypothetical protein
MLKGSASFQLVLAGILPASWIAFRATGREPYRRE